MNNKLVNAVLLPTLMISTAVFAEDVVNEWTGTGELGFVVNNGNTQTQTITSKITGVKDSEHWRHHLVLSGTGKSDKNDTTAEKYFGEAKSDRKLNEHYYGFALGNYEKDRFSGFDHQANLSAGAGRRMLEDSTMVLDVELGIGVRFSETDAGTTKEEPVIRIAGDFTWELSETSSFKQTLSADAGKDSTVYKSLTSLAAQVTGSVSLKASFEAKHTTSVPLGSKKTDTTTTLNLTYSF
ncbi:MAG: DUF481 domain-containing protein [Pseudomonadales bacterium]|nr:DUF481 domain-containing protein [Pseudomonadales bacterium]